MKEEKRYIKKKINPFSLHAALMPYDYTAPFIQSYYIPCFPRPGKWTKFITHAVRSDNSWRHLFSFTESNVK